MTQAILKKHFGWFHKATGVCSERIQESSMVVFVPPGQENEDGLFIDDDDTAMVCVTEKQFGIYRSKWFSSPRVACDIKSIVDIKIWRSKKQAKIVFNDRGDITFRFQNKNDLATFTNSLIEKRKSMIGHARPAYHALLGSIKEGSFSKLGAIAEIAKAEKFHPSVCFLNLILLIEAGKREAAVKYLLKYRTRWVSLAEQYPVEFANVVSQVRCTSAEILEICEAFDIDENTHVRWKQIVGAVIYSHQNQWDTSYRLFATAYANTESAAQAKVTESAETKPVDLQPEEQKLRLAIAQLAFRLVGPYWNLYSTASIGDNWIRQGEPVQSTNLANTQDEPIRLQQLERDWFGTLYQYFLGFSVGSQVDQLWRQRRGNHFNSDSDPQAVAISAPDEKDSGQRPRVDLIDALELWDRAKKVLPQNDIRYWKSSLLGCESAIEQKNSKQARQILDEGFRTSIACSQGSDLPIQKFSHQIKGVYEGLASSNLAKAKLYAEPLQSELAWVDHLLVKHSSKENESARSSGQDSTVGLAAFSEWVSRVADLPSIKSDSQVGNRIAKFSASLDDNQLRVVVGGETSSGKSTFINRLLQCDILKSHRQEATAVPTHIRHAKDWKVVIHFADCRKSMARTFVATPTVTDKVKEYVQQYGFLGSETVDGVERISISGPIETLASGVEIIDSPGLNAHTLRTQMADETLEESHACVFVMDARNALKGGEMDAIRMNQEVVGRTLFVLNKIDLLQSDDEFDVDDNPLQNVTQHVRSQLAEGSAVEEVALFALSSLDDKTHAPELGRFRDRLDSVLSDSKDQLLMFRARRLAKQLAETAVKSARDSLAVCEAQIADLTSKLPEDPAMFKKFLGSRIKKQWNKQKGMFESYVDRRVGALMASARNQFSQKIENSDDLDDIAKLIKSEFRNEIDSIVDEVEATRKAEWEQFAVQVFQSTAAYFRELYADINYEYEVDIAPVMKAATPMPIPGCSGLFSDIDEKISGVGGQATAGALIGAAIGLLAGPAGAAVGGAIGGGLFSASASSEAKQEIKNLVHERINTVEVQIEAAIEEDLRGIEKQPKLLKLFIELAEKEGRQFERRIKQERRRLEKELKQVESHAQQLEQYAIEAKSWEQQFTTVGSDT